MKHTLIIIVVTLIVTGCSSFDKTDISSIADYIETTCKDEQVYQLSELLNIEQDSLTKHPSFDEIRKLTYILTKESPILLKEEIESHGRYGEKNFKRFYKTITDYYQMNITYQIRNDKVIAVKSINFNNLNRRCEIEKEYPYCPDDKVIIDRFWTAKKNDYNFSAGEVEIKNNLDFDIDYIKFQIELTRFDSAPDEQGMIWNKAFFTQTVESHKKIYSGDIVRIKIPNISNFHTNFKLDEGNFQYYNRLIEVKPNPNSYWCEKLEELKLLVNSNKNNNK